MPDYTNNRKFMQCPNFLEGMKTSDQSKEIKAPPFGSDIKGETFTFAVDNNVVTHDSYLDLVDVRRSKRNYAETAMSTEQLAFMLYSCQGIQSMRGDVATFRPVPSGGARHPFETYLTVKNVEGLKPGLYKYHPAANPGTKIVTIEYLSDIADYDETITNMVAGQKWAAGAPVILFFSCVPYKAEWRYVDLAHRVMLIDLGHLGQNAMLSAAALGLGSCCMAAYNQQACDDLLKLDSINEYTVYAVSVGTPKEINNH